MRINFTNSLLNDLVEFVTDSEYIHISGIRMYSEYSAICSRINELYSKSE